MRDLPAVRNPMQQNLATLEADTKARLRQLREAAEADRQKAQRRGDVVTYDAINMTNR